MIRILFSLLLLLPGFSSSIFADHLSSHLMFSARLHGDQEVPAVTTDAQGVAVFVLDEKKSTLYINVSLNNLSGPITGMHIHEGAFGANGGVIFNLSNFLTGNRARGAVYDITPDVVARLLSGGYYINVHTELNPGGEIRGQIWLETDHRYTAFMSGDNEVPQVISDGRGLGIFQLNHANTAVHFKVLFRELTSAVTGAHIHQAAAGVNGPVIFDLGPFLTGNYMEGTWEPDAIELEALFAGELYINVHTENNPGGEIRGQILLLPGLTFDLTLSGDNENPPVDEVGLGLGVVTIRPDLTEVDYYILYDNMTGDVMGAHIHSGIAGVNGDIVIDLSGDINAPDNFISGSTTLTLELFNTLLNGGHYINLHTEAYPSGELRGQIYKFAREGYLFDMNGGQEAPPVTTTGVGAGLVSIDRDQSNAHFMLLISGLAGEFTASHFHQASPGVSGGVIFNIGSTFDAFGAAEGYWDQSSGPPFDAGPMFRAHQVYVNVHTDMFPGGEIRGNVIRASDLFIDHPFDPGFGANFILSAQMSGDDENPPVTTDGVGLATVYFDSDRTSAVVNVSSSRLSGPITGIHIHDGVSGTNGPVIFPLINQGNRVQAEIPDITTDQLQKMINGNYYVNIHTAENPGGEIRGQLFTEQDVTFVAILDGQQENPSVDTEAKGLGSFHYTIGQLNLDVNVQVTGLSSEITGAHLHEGAPGENGAVLIDLGGLRDGNRIAGTVTLTITDLITLASGNMYVNVHTVNNPGGEIRGQLNFLSGLVFDGWMSGVQENPFATTSASGLAVASVSGDLSAVGVWMVTDGLSGTIGASHFHRAEAKSNGGVVLDLGSGLEGNSLSFAGSFPEELLLPFLEGDIYINAHTPAYPGGELRGQLYRLAREGYGFDLCAEQEVGGTIVAPNSSGSGMVSIDRNHSNLNLYVVTDGLTGDIASSHIHGPAPVGVNAGVIADLTPFYDEGSLFLYGATAAPALIDLIRSGETYVNVHTTLHPAGEIRGQIVMELLCSITIGVDPLSDILTDVRLSPVPVEDFLRVNLETQASASLTFSMVDIAGKIISTDQHHLLLGENMLTLNTAMLLPGFYTLMITDGKVAQAYKFIK